MNYEVNRHSPAAYLNEERDGTTPVPDSADASAAPDWGKSVEEAW